MIPEDVLAEILRRTDIVDLIGGYLPLKGTGRTHKALCPFHTEKTPSFVVNPERQIFHCFGCGEGGDAITFLMKHERLTFPEAARHLAERAGVPLPSGRAGGGSGDGQGRHLLLEVHRQAVEHFRENLRGPEGDTARAYLAGRGLTPALIERFELGYALPRWDGLLRALKKRGYPERVLEAAGLIVPRQSIPAKETGDPGIAAGASGQAAAARRTGHYDRFRHRLMIPIWDAGGKVIGFGGRALESTEVKYLNSPETALYRKGTQLYGLNLAARSIRERKQALIVEGYFDAILLQAHGFDHAVATLGTALTTEQARLLARYTSSVVLLFDPDASGIGAARRILEQLINVDLDWRIVLLPGGLDPDAYVRAHGATSFAAALGAAQDLVDFFLDRRTSGMDMADPVQRARAVDALVEVVGMMDNPVRREGYVQRIAQRTPISDRSLLEAVARHRSRAGRRDAGPGTAATVAAPPGAEEQLVCIALHYPAWRERIVAALPPEDVRDPVLRRIFTEYIVPGGTGPTADAQGTPRPMSLHPPDVQQRLSSLWARDPWSTPPRDAAHEGPEGGDAGREAVLARTVEDCLARIRRQREMGQRQVLRQALEAADRGGDREQVLRLLAEHPSVKGGRGDA
jgi:DNA primase